MIDTLATFADQVTTVAREVGFEGKLGGQAAVPSAAGLWRDLTDNVNQLAAQLTNQIRAISEVSTAVTKGDFSRTIDIEARGEVGELTSIVNEMIQNLRDTTRKNTEQDWYKSNLAKFTSMLQGQRDIRVVTQLIISELAPLIGVQAGAVYVRDASEEGEPQLRLMASYALPKDRLIHETIEFGEGLVGQCALEGRRLILNDLPAAYLKIGSSLGNIVSTHIVVLPVLYEGEIKAVVELASYERLSEIHLLFLDQLTQSIGIMLNTISSSMRTEELLKQSQSLTGELQSQQLELKQTNDELEEKARLLQERNAEIERRTREIEEARAEVEKKAEQLALTSKYKSQFLANMSHELRTPLNSLLILSKQLSANAEGNMTAEQIEYAETIRSAGADLLTLINDILDLSKIESGTTAVDLQECTIESIESELKRTFSGVAIDKNLRFEVSHDEDVPASIVSDPTRIQQVLKNLLSNAFKFTHTGSVTLHIGMAHDHALPLPGPAIAFAVRDTGVGIAPEKFNVVFEAFQQADMGTSRKYGGTGLGLAISREIAGLLGGEIGIESEVGVGSTFTLYHPAQRHATQRQASLEVTTLSDDRETVTPADRTLLVIEDDRTFARVLAGFARARGFKALIAQSARDALDLANRYVPDAITLDISLPDADGWNVLDELKRSGVTSQIPVHVISGGEHRDRAIQAGAMAYLQKPISEQALVNAFDELLGFTGNRKKNVLLVEDDLMQLNALVNLIESGEMRVTAVGSAESALSTFGSQPFDCVIVDLGLPGMDGETLIESLRRQSANVPIVVYTARSVDREMEARLKRLCSTIMVKDGSAPERLLDELNFFLHRVEADLGGSKRPVVANGESLKSKRLLIVDDDTRNIYALEKALRAYGMEIMSAESGLQGIEILKDRPVDIVLMDIMMPEMDGYETIRRIRSERHLSSIPIIALTAKAMKGDRDACIAAGASDYVSKPVDIERLVALFTLWLNR
jgi:CheY-like chemotaxis protein/HAMP domain-containing protein/GAF domain-containing protein